MLEKSKARFLARTILKNLLEKETIEKAIVKILQKEFSSLSSAIVYSALPYEINIRDFYTENTYTKFFFPKVISIPNKTMEFISPVAWSKGAYGIFEPVGKEKISPQDVEMIFLPCLGVNSKGFRLGQGGGFYDKALRGCPSSKLVGITLCELFPLEFLEESHDIKMGRVITEKNLIFIEN